MVADGDLGKVYESMGDIPHAIAAYERLVAVAAADGSRDDVSSSRRHLIRAYNAAADAKTREGDGDGARVVTMLLGLAGRPLAANVEVGDDEVGSDEELGERIAGAFGGMTFAEDEDVTSFDEVGDENGFASDSTLSVWSESDEDYIVDVKDCRRGDEMATSEIPPSESMSEGEDPGFSWEDNLLVQDSAPESTMRHLIARRSSPSALMEVLRNHPEHNAQFHHEW